MRTNFLRGILLFALFFTAKICFGQSSTDDNFPGPSKFLGYNGPQDLDFRTNNTTRMRLMQNGALGLGALNFTPSALLHANLLSFTSGSGALLRTDGSHNQDLTWSMWSGTTVANSSQKARFYSPTHQRWQDGHAGELAAAGLFVEGEVMGL